jgi:hypothetical protein
VGGTPARRDHGTAQDDPWQWSGYPRQDRKILAGQGTFVDGLTQETCRYFTHTGYGLAAIADFAETTRNQGQSLYPEIAERLRQALGFQTTYELGDAPPS